MSRITTIRKVANGSLQAELLDTVHKPGRTNVLFFTNIGDERFVNNGSERRAWFPVTKRWLQESLGISEENIKKIDALAQNDKLELNIENPRVNGQVLAVEIQESIHPDDWQFKNAKKAAKQIMITDQIAANKNMPTQFTLGKYVNQNGYFLADGNYIFSHSFVRIKPEVKHTFVEGELVPESELGGFGATLAEPMKVTEGAMA